nr:OmpA family protein [Solemya velesiana gill symbiont]
MAESLSEFPEFTIHIDAFADQRGGDDFNLSLSSRRAETVARHLQALGVDGARIRKTSHGERAVEYALNDREGLGFERRVLIYFCLEKA